MASPFIGRRNELQLLDNLWLSSSATLLILYGRRRVGKTRLLTHWLKRHPGQGLYWVAEPTSALDQLRSFSQALFNYASPDEPAPLDFTYANWDQAFRQVALMAQGERIALFIDELPYLLMVNPAISGTLQKMWDHAMKDSNLILALSGSQMGMMQSMLTYEAPLYGRATGQIKLPPLSFGVTKEYFPTYGPSERVTVYAMLGGVPAYWERINQSATVMDNLHTLLLPASSWLHDEPRLLLQDFVNDPYNYVGIMRAISQGAITTARIATRTGLSRGHVSRYLGILRDTGFVERQVPITEDPSVSRRGRYYLTDPFMRFHYHFLAQYQAKLALGEQQQMMQTIEQELPFFIEKNTWRELCKEWLLRASAHDELDFPVEEVGAVWMRTTDSDVAGIDPATRTLVLGTCHWNFKPLDLTHMYQLLQTTEALVPDEGQWTVHYLGFARQGWSAEAQANVDNLREMTVNGHNWSIGKIELFDLERIDSDLTRWAAE